ncbi:PKD-like domain-containing protein [Mucilaginibacter sp.]|uniref:Ig-like domain-containing protein n=1 Tax=Mucilaginibacter sp. TaxID=1882438 RepID=UPI003D0C22DE
MRLRLLIFFFLILSLKGYGQSCTLSVSLTQSAPTICSGNSVTLTATTSGGTAPFTFTWSTGETTPSINVNKAGTYTVTVSDKTAGCQPVTKNITVTTAITPGAPVANSAVVCLNSSATLTATSPGGSYEWYDSPVGGNLLASGATFTTPPITAPTTYYVQTTSNGCTSTRTSVSVFLSGNPTVANVGICAGNTATLTANGGNNYTWYDAATGGNIVSNSQSFTTPPLNTNTTYYVVAIVNGCTSARTPGTVFVNAAPQPPTGSNLSVCSGSVANLHADVSAGVVDWFTQPTGGTSLISSPDYTTPALTATTTYYAQTTNNGCISSRTPITVTVNALPQTPASQTDSTCYNTSITLTASATPTDTYNWYDSASGNNLLATGNTFTTPVLTNSTTYYVQAVNATCTSALSPVNVIVKKAVTPPSVSGAFVCSGSAATLTANSPGGTYQWFDAVTGGNLLSTGASYTTPALVANTTYYVQTTIGGCTSTRTAVTVSILPVVAAPTAVDATICSGSQAILTANGAVNNYSWYDAATGGNLLSNAQVFVTPALTVTTVYYVESSANGCTSTRTAVTVNVNPVPPAPTASNVSICPNTSASLTATAPSGTIEWYDAPGGGNLLFTGNTYNTPVLNSNKTYYIQNTAGSCSSGRTAVTVTINAKYNPGFQYSSGTFCFSSPNPTPAIIDPAGGTFSAAPAGLVFNSSTTGEINIAASTPGKYVVSFVSNGSCSGTTSAIISIVTTTDATFTYNGPYCQDGANPFPMAGNLATFGNFSAVPAGLVFVNTTTGEINLAASKAGTYTVTNTILASGQCPSSVASSTVTIFDRVLVNAGPNQTVITGTPVQLNGSISSGATTGTWSGGTGSFSSSSALNAVYTPGSGENTAILTLTSSDPPGPCGAKQAQIVISFITGPLTPTAQSTSVCAGSPASLSATAPGGTYQWYDAPTGGTLLATGPVYTTPPLLTTTNYYVQTTKNGLTSGRTTVVVTVNATATAPVCPSQIVCQNSSAALTATSTAGSTFEWFDAVAGGNLVSTSSTYTTPPISANTSYYVRASINGCTSPLTKVDLTVTQVPNITSAATGSICSGNAQNYTITADIATATFLWSRAQIAGISNPAVTAQTSANINEALINTTGAAINVTYVITPMSGNCSGPALNYIVTVYPTPTVTSAAKATICNGATDNYDIVFNTPGTNFSWSRAAVTGISNAPVSGQSAATIREVLYNTTNAPVDVTYVITSSSATCTGTTFNLVFTVNPQGIVTSPALTTACSGYAEDYVIKSNIPNATFRWSRGALPYITNPAVTDQTSVTINETLNSTVSYPAGVYYTIVPIVNGCDGTPFLYTVQLNPVVPLPVANANSPVCLGSTVHLRASNIPNATFLWTGPNGYTSTAQNPDITNVSKANVGTYTLVAMVNGCSSLSDTVSVAVNDPPVSNAGPDQTVCISVNSVSLNGKISGGTTTGIWTTAGTGTFLPASDNLNAQYIPSAADKAAGSVVLSLASTSKDDCTIATSSLTVKFGPLPAVDAGPDQDICSQSTTVQLAGKVLIAGGGKWSTSGTGTFSPSATQLDAVYMPSVADEQNGSVELTLLAINAGVCDLSTDSMKVTFTPPPTVSAGGTRYVLHGRTITLTPTVSDSNVKYLWSPNIGINDATAKNPVITGNVDITYRLTVTDSRGCVSSDTAFIKVSPEVIINNTFTPNGDGVNDLWVITGLIAYADATVDIYTRYGTQVYHSIGYAKAWDGTFNGKQLPVGVYYYVINTKQFNQVLSGYVTILR